MHILGLIKNHELKMRKTKKPPKDVPYKLPTTRRKCKSGGRVAPLRFPSRITASN